MANVRFAWGIDVGNRALKAIKLVRSDTGLRVDDFEVIEHETFLSAAGDNRESLIQASLANFVQRHATKGGVAAVGVSGVASFSRFIKLPPVEAKKIPEIVRFEAIQQIPFPLDDVEWNYQLFRTPDSPDVEVGIFAMRRDLVNAHIKHFTDVGLNVQVVQTNPLAVYNAMYHDGKLKGTTMIVDLGAENTDLIIADGETIWLRSIPIGGNALTDVLVKSFKLTFNKAEELKRNAYSSKFAPQILKAMRPVFADLVTEINRSIGFYASVHRDSRIKKVIATGGTFRLNGLQKYLQQNLSLDVEKLNDFTAGNPADAKLAATFNQNVLSLVGAYGLAIQGMGEGKITSSLLPAKIRRAKAWHDKTKWFGAAAACFVAGAAMSVGSYYMQTMAYDSQSPVRKSNDALLSDNTRLDRQWTTAVENAGAADRQTITNLRSLTAYRTLWPALLTDITRAIPQPPVAYVNHNADELKKTPRDSRSIILLDGITASYEADLNAALAKLKTTDGFDPVPDGTPATASPAAAATATPTPGSMSPGMPGAAPGMPGGMPGGYPGTGMSGAMTNVPQVFPTGTRGFVVTLDITTPHKGNYLYILQTLVPKLLNLNQTWMDKYNKAHPQAPKQYFIRMVGKPSSTSRRQIFQDQDRQTRLKAAYDAGQEVRGLVAPTAAAGGGAPVPFAPGTPYAPMTPYSPAPFTPGTPYSPAPYGPGAAPGGPGMPYTPAAPTAPGGAAVAGQPTPEWLKDPVTGEDISNDWELRLTFLVQIEP